MRRKLAGKKPTDESPKSDPRLDDPDTLDKLHVVLRKMLKAGEIHEHDYYKSVIDLAARWILLDRREDAVSLLCELSDDYVKHGMPYQMEGDPKFKRKAYAIAAWLDPDIPDLTDEDVELSTMLLKTPVAKA